MKKVFSCILVIVMCFSLCACGKTAEAEKADELILAIGEVNADSEESIVVAEAYYNTLTEKQKAQVENYDILLQAIEQFENLEIVVEEPVEYEIGETIQIDGVEFTLTNIVFGDNLSKMIDENYLLPVDVASQHNAVLPNEGNVLVSFSYVLKNTSKVEIDLARHQWKLDIVYGEGYVFSSEVFDNQMRWLGDEWTNLQPEIRYVAPLSSKEARGYIEVPLEVFENAEEPLKVVIHLATETADKENCDYPLDARYYVRTTHTYNIR